jgi:hypothetical protein
MGTIDAGLRAKIDILDFAWANLRLDGSKLTKEGVATIIDGGLVPSASIAESSEVRCHENAAAVFRDLGYMQVDLDRAALEQIAGAWSDFFDTGFRGGSPVLHHLGFTPPYHGDVPVLLDELFREIRVRYDRGDVTGRAARVHSGLIFIYPFKEHSETIARAAMQYELLRGGMPIVDIGLSETEYNTIVAESIKTGYDARFAGVLESAIARKRKSCGE